MFISPWLDSGLGRWSMATEMGGMRWSCSYLIVDGLKSERCVTPIDVPRPPAQSRDDHLLMSLSSTNQFHLFLVLVGVGINSFMKSRWRRGFPLTKSAHRLNDKFTPSSPPFFAYRSSSSPAPNRNANWGTFTIVLNFTNPSTFTFSSSRDTSRTPISRSTMQ